MKIRDNVYSVGAVDSEVRIFHGYQTPIGTSYNAYLIIDDKITLIDFVKAPFAEVLLKNITYAIARVLEAKYIFVASPTLNNNMLPTVSAFLTYMKGLKPKNRIGKAFGSYGWSGESIQQINDILSSCGFQMEEPLKVMWNI